MLEHRLSTSFDSTGEHCYDIDAMDLAQNRTRVGTHCVSLDDAVDTSSCAQLRTSLSLWSTLALLLALRRRFALRDGRDARPT